MARICIAMLMLSVFGLVATGSAEGRGKSSYHVVERGQTLWGISRAYGCRIDEIKQANEMGENLIRPGQKLEIPKCDGGGGGDARARGGKKSGEDGGSVLILTHEVARGDTLGGIARKYDTTVKELQRRNRISGNLIRPGQKLRVEVGASGQGRTVAGQSVGSPSNGRLVNGMQMPPGAGYYRRRPHRAWGANHTIFHIRRVVAAVRGRFPKVHKLAIGDISARKGGRLAQHKSHQSGLDVDIGLYFKKRPKGYPNNFVKADKDNMDIQATWAMLEAFAATADAAGGVDKMFLDYELQKVIYEWAREHKVAKAKLARVFQYPHGKGSPAGIIRDDPGHDSHVHVRFKCPKNDKGCE